MPEEISTMVFNKGTWKGLNTLIPNGGQTDPTSILGDNLLWKKAQNKLKNSIISDNKNPKNPNFKLRLTILVWNKLASKNKISLNQKLIITNKKVKGIII